MITKLCHVNAFDNLLLLETKPKVVKIHKKLEKHRQTNKNLGLFIIFLTCCSAFVVGAVRGKEKSNTREQAYTW